MLRVSPLNSQVAFLSQFSGIVFNIADFPEVFHRSCLARVLPGAFAQFVPPFGVFLFGGFPFSGPPESLARADTQ